MIKLKSTYVDDFNLFRTTSSMGPFFRFFFYNENDFMEFEYLNKTIRLESIAKEIENVGFDYYDEEIKDV